MNRSGSFSSLAKNKTVKGKLMDNRFVDKQKLENKSKGVLPVISAWAGVVSMPEIFAVLTTLGLLLPGYSAVSEFGSELGVGWYGAWAERVGVGIFGLLLIIFALGFYKSIAEFVSRKRLYAITTLLVLSGTGAIVSGIFTVSNPSLHGLGGVMVFGFPTVAQVLAGQKLRSFPGFRTYGKYTYINGIATLILDIFSTFYPIFKLVPPLVPMVLVLQNQLTGVIQRIQIVVTWGWFTVSGVRSLRLQKLNAMSSQNGLEQATISSETTIP
jgi:hypothetical protein